MARAEIIKFLSEHRGKYYRSIKLSAKIGISRTAIIRACTQLRKENVIDAKPLQMRGYKYGIK